MVPQPKDISRGDIDTPKADPANLGGRPAGSDLEPLIQKILIKISDISLV
jgi:hypothetical protein